MKFFFPGILVSICLFSSCGQQPRSQQQHGDIPRYDHIIIVMEENHSYGEVIGSGNAPYISQLAKGGALFTNSHGMTHPSQPNYLLLYSGSTQGVVDDQCKSATVYHTPNLGAALISKGFSFKGYAQTMPCMGFTGCDSQVSALTDVYLYARKHTPWVNWLGNGENNIAANLSLPMADFPKDFSALPTVAFVVPDQDHDMHNIGLPGDAAAIQRGDKWLKENLQAYTEWAKSHNSLLIVTFDEDDYRPMNSNHIPTIFYGAKVMKGEYVERINHCNILHTIEAMYQLPVSDTIPAEAIKDVWNRD